MIQSQTNNLRPYFAIILFLAFVPIADVSGQSHVRIVQADQVQDQEANDQGFDRNRPPQLDRNERPQGNDPNQLPGEGSKNGWQLIQDQKFAEAIEWFSRRLQADPNSEKDAIGLGAAYVSAEQFQQAIALLETTANQFQSADAYFWLGRAYLGNECFCKAVAAFKRVCQLDPQYENIRFWIGSAYLQWDQPRRALNYLNCLQDPNPAVQARTELQKGVAFSSIGLRGTAYDLFSLAEGLSEPGSSGAESAINARQSLVDAIEESRMTGSIKLGQFYDDNPAVIPDTNLFGNSGIGQFETGATQLQTQFNRLLSGVEDGDLTLGVSTFNTFNYEGGDDVDVWDTLVLLSRNRYFYDGVRTYQTNWNASYDYLLFGYVPLLQRGRLGSSLTIHQNDFNWIQFSGRASFNDFMNQRGFDQTPRDVDATNLATSVDKFRRLGHSNWLVQTGFQYDRNLAEGADFDYDGYRIGMGLTWEHPETQARFQWMNYYYPRSYDNIDSIFGVQREDQQYLTTVSLKVPLGCKDRFVVFDYILDRNDSNIILNDYLRNQYGVSTQWNF